nr:hypothetical protein [Tanacetum cinerariifolium]
MNTGQDRQMQMVGGIGRNQFRQYVSQNVRNQNGYNVVQNVAVQNPGVHNVRNRNGLIVVPMIANQNPNGNDGSAKVNGRPQHYYGRVYIRLKEEKAHRSGKVYNWENAMYGKIWYDEDVHDLISVETKFPAIVFNDALTSEAAISCEP